MSYLIPLSLGAMYIACNKSNSKEPFMLPVSSTQATLGETLNSKARSLLSGTTGTTGTTGAPTISTKDKAEAKRLDDLITGNIKKLPYNLRRLQGALVEVKAKGLENAVPNFRVAVAAIEAQRKHTLKRETDSLIHNNMVPFFSGNHSGTTVGTDLEEGNFTTSKESAIQPILNTYTGVQNLDWKSKTSRDPETTLFKPQPNRVFGKSIERPANDRLLDTQTKRPDLKPTQTIRVGPGIGVPSDQTAGKHGFHDSWRPTDHISGYNPIDAVKKEGIEAPDPREGRNPLSNSGPTSVSFAGGLGDSDSFTQSSSNGSAFVNKKCNTYVTASNRQTMSNANPKKMPTIEDTKYDHRGETHRGQSAPYVGNERAPNPMHSNDMTNKQSNIRITQKGTDREQFLRPNHGGGFSKISGSTSLYLNETSRGQSAPVANWSNPGAGTHYTDQSALKTTLRGGESNPVLPGSRPNTGFSTLPQDSAKSTIKESTNYSYSGNPSNRSAKPIYNIANDSQRNNKRAFLEPSDRPVPEGAKTQADLKTMVGQYRVKTLLPTDNRKMHHNGNFQIGRNFGESTVRHTKTLVSNRETLPGHTFKNEGVDRPIDTKSTCFTTGPRDNL